MTISFKIIKPKICNIGGVKFFVFTSIGGNTIGSTVQEIYHFGFETIILQEFAILEDRDM